MTKKIHMAIAYDFDGTLSPGNMQEHAFIPTVKSNTPSFWKEVRELAKKKDADEILAYMQLMLKKANQAEVPVKKSDFASFGKTVPLFPGVEEWFDRVNAYAKKKGIILEHYIISSGIKEMIKATKIGRKFKKIYASSYIYNHHGVAEWPALAVNYTTKTQYLFRINKGSLEVYDHSIINKYVEHDKRPVPFHRMVFIGDGTTDIPCMRLIKDQGGHSIAVYKPRSPDKKKAEILIKENRANFFAPADYREGNKMDDLIKAIIDRVAADARLYELGKKN